MFPASFFVFLLSTIEHASLSQVEFVTEGLDVSVLPQLRQVRFIALVEVVRPTSF